MKTSTILQRVADFLSKYPPFEFMSVSDRLALAQNGRVNFHESDEVVFAAGEQRSRRFYVVQQGTVKLFKETERGEELVDVRVEGDLLGVFWIVHAERYVHTARTSSDTILYAFDIEHFKDIATHNPQVNRYLAAYFSMHPGHNFGASAILDDQDFAASDAWLSMAANSLNVGASCPLQTCLPTTKIADAAAKLRPGYQDAVVVVDAQQRGIGLLSEAELLAGVVHAGISIDAAVESIMSREPVTVMPGLPIGGILLKMLRGKSRYACITADGTAQTPVTGLLTDRALQLFHGRLPNLITSEMKLAQTPEELLKLRNRVDELVYHYLENNVSIDWIAEFLMESENTLVQRLIELARNSLLQQGLKEPEVDFVWIAMHSEGRKERFLRSAQKTLLVFGDPSETERSKCQGWFLALGERVSLLLEQCGIPHSARGLMANNAQCCMSLSQWQKKYSDWIAQPQNTDIALLTSFFDLRRVAGSSELLELLQAHIGHEIKAHVGFVPYLAKCALENLPPVTIFRDSVIDKSGILWTSIDTKVHAMLPLVDVARVFALKFLLFNSTATIERFEHVSSLLPEVQGLFEEAAQAMRSTLALQSLTGMRRRDNGQYILASELSKINQQDFKNVFRTIVELLEFTSAHFQLNERCHV